MMSDIVYSHLIVSLARLFTFIFARGTCACISASASGIMWIEAYSYIISH